MLSKKQRQVVECNSHCLAVAGPGSGKTRVLVYKADHILRADPGARILVTTFTQEAAAEVRQRILKQVGDPNAAKRVASGTFHSISLSQLKHAGFNGTIIGAGQMRQYVERAIAESRACIDIDIAVGEIERVKSTPGYEPSNDDIGKLYIAYEKITKRNNVMDFTDMLSRAVRMMREGEIQPKNCNYLFVDEKQDIDDLQYAWCEEHIKNGAIFTGIGDDDQSIYKFRRALGFEGMMRMHREYGAEIIKLDENYRSNVEIVSVALKLIENNTNRLEKKIEAVRGPGGSVKAFYCGSAENEAYHVCQAIKESAIIKPELNGEEIYEVPRDEWAVLARNSHLLMNVSMELDAMGIPYTNSGDSIWEKAPICHAIGLLSSLNPPCKKAGLDAALHYAGIDESTLIALHEEYGDDFARMFTGISDFSRFTPGTRATLEKFAGKCTDWFRELKKGRANNVICGVYDWFLDYLDSNQNVNGAKKGYERDVRRLRAAKSIMLRMDGDLQKRLSRLLKKNEKNKNKTSGVFLGTMHSSKGLEFKNVWLITMDNKVIPDEKEWTEETHEEERRLFYVGMTRAKDRLYISCTEQPSSFIDETGIALVRPPAPGETEPVVID